MSKYTTGEIARLCGVSVRTVQYYDTRGLLIPSELSEGGRRLYSEEDVKRMQTICFLRELDVSINSIGELLSEEHPENVISILLEQQKAALCEERDALQKKLDALDGLQRGLKSVANFSVESIGDIAYTMKNKNKLKKMRALMVILGTPISILQWVSIILWITNGFWWLFLIWLGVATIFAVLSSMYYFKRVAYICPECHTVFKPRFKEMFWANHTPTTRKLVCTNCGHKGYCVETYAEKNVSENA